MTEETQVNDVINKISKLSIPILLSVISALGFVAITNIQNSIEDNKISIIAIESLAQSNRELVIEMRAANSLQDRLINDIISAGVDRELRIRALEAWQGVVNRQ